MSWFHAICKDLSKVADAMEFFQAEYEEGRAFLGKLSPVRIDHMAARLPGIIEMRYAQYQEVEAILKYIEVLEDQEIVKQTRNFMDHYPRELKEYTAKRYAEGHEDVIALKKLALEVAVVRNNYLSLFKGTEALHYQIRNIVALRVAGIDDSTFGG